MPQYISEATVNPYIPDSALTKEDMAFLARFGFQTEQAGEKGEPMTYLFAPDYKSSDFDEGEEVDEEDLARRLMAIIKRSGGKLKYLYVGIACTCSRFIPDSFGGGAIFVTERSYRFTSTAGWISHQIGKFNKTDEKKRKGNNKRRTNT